MKLLVWFVAAIRPKPLPEPAGNVDLGTLMVHTLWCGKGHLLWHHNVVDGREIQGTNAKSFGELSTVAPHLDSCCRMHDYCPAYAKPGGTHGMCADAGWDKAWQDLRAATLGMDLGAERWEEVSKPFMKGGLPGFVPYEECGPIEDIGGSREAFASACECDRAFLQCLNKAARQPGEHESTSFIREVYFHTAISVKLPLGPLSKLLTTNVDRDCIERQGDKFVRDYRTDRFKCVCKGSCGAGGGEDRAWCYTKDACGAPGKLGKWDFCDKFCFDGEQCNAYDPKWVDVA